MPEVAELVFSDVSDRIVQEWADSYVELRSKNKIENIYSIVTDENVIVCTKEELEYLIENSPEPEGAFTKLLKELNDMEVKEGQTFLIKAIDIAKKGYLIPPEDLEEEARAKREMIN